MAIYLRTGKSPHPEVAAEAFAAQLAPDCPWIDLVNATPAEIQAVEACLAIAIPTREEMREIESTSRLYHEDGARFMTTPLLVSSDLDAPVPTEIGFILVRQHLVTLRETDPKSFRMTLQQLDRGLPPKRDAVFLALLEAIVDRQADLLEKTFKEAEDVSRRIFTRFRKAKDTERNLREAIYTLGRSGDLIARERDCIIALARLVQFAGQEDFDSEPAAAKTSHLFPRLRPVTRDLQSLSEFASFLSSKISFMLDATLGLISIEQNSIVKIFTVAAVIFLPPTLVASVYGMNFKHMPELDAAWGYPMAIGLMVMSVLLPLLYCRRKGWL